MKTFQLFAGKLLMACAAIVLILSACKKNKNEDMYLVKAGPDLTFYALSSDNRLLKLNAKDVSTVIAQTSISGLQTNETILGIDFRPATGQLYGVGSTSRIYVINVETGVARAIGTSAFTPAISGTTLAFDFNPTVDRIRLVTSTGQNLRLNPETGTVAATDGIINGGTNPSITAVAYNQNRAGAATTTLFDIDISSDKLYKQDPPNDGKLIEIGDLGFDVQPAGGFDISPSGSSALAALTVAGKTSLYDIDLTSGKAIRIANSFNTSIIGLAIPTEPVAYMVNGNNELVIFNPANAMSVTKPITGMSSNEAVLGIDFRPANGQLYALGSTSRLYTINASSGAAAPVGTGQLATILIGTEFGFDFNPTVDRIRVVSNAGQNLRLNPNDGTIAAVDGNLSPGSPAITAAAYTNNFAGATTTVLYDIDTQTNKLYKQDPPNMGTLVEVGALGVTATAANGFDIGSTSGLAYAALTVGGTTRLYTINLQTGAAALTSATTITGTVRGFTLGLGF